ncbi:copper amine oxidase N-terminal domain-containing protein [Paenibacillaceae bacterium WGS1546]|uniref:copper amine oxidase N-terminal domain-containing protein n=1 Tax=Cohnella sp. WGS1546 TaxID=3366810 RepID=UPI00372D8240
MKRMYLFLIALCLMIPYSVAAASKDDKISVIINGDVQKFNAPTQMINGSVLVPMRAVFEKLDASVEWHQENQQIVARKDFTTIVLTVGSKNATINNKNAELNVVPQIINGNTMVPLRFVGEALGANVKWFSAENTVVIELKSKWEQVSLKGLKEIIATDWSPDDVLTVGTKNGVMQYISGKWEQFDANNSPIKNEEVRRIKWSNDGKLVVASTTELKNADFVRVYERGRWDKILLPKIDEPDNSVKFPLGIGHLWYLGWSPDNILTASFGLSGYEGIWQYINGEWVRLENSNQINIANEIIFLNDKWVLKNTNDEIWVFEGGKSTLQNNIPTDGLFELNGTAYVGGYSKGVYKYSNGKWTEAMEYPFSEMKDFSFSSKGFTEGISFEKNRAALVDGNKQNMMWLFTDGYWGRLNDRSLPLTFEPADVEIQDSWKKQIDEGWKVNSKTTTCSKGKCETKEGTENYKIATKFSDGAFIESVSLSKSGMNMLVSTYKIHQLYFTKPLTNKDEVITFEETPRHLWIYKDK